MDSKAEIREFLSSRRAKITPGQAEITSYGERRVPGLRRNEVAQLAGISGEYYTRIERGNLTGVSDGVLESLSKALQLDEAERTHLFDLARSASLDHPGRGRTGDRQVRPNVQRTIDAITVPSYVRDRRRDILAANPLAEALYSPLFEDPFRPANSARFTFLSARAQEFFADWHSVARDAVAALRIEAGRNPYDRSLSELVGELSTRSEAFRQLWAEHDVRFHTTGTKRMRHPVVGELELTFEAMEIAADPGLTIVTYGAEPGSRSEEGLRLLATLVATEAAERTRSSDPIRPTS
ncbi:MAG TPA: helix-turn-helix transcriptional regulator [Solirubrobacterales bacterium]